MPQTVCPRCGKESPDAPLYCSHCGASLEEPYQAPQPGIPLQQPQPQPTKSGFATGMGMGVGGCVGVIIVCFLVLAGIGACGVLMLENAQRQAEQKSPSPDQPKPTASGITLEKFNQLREGMTYNQVVGVLGQPGTEISRSSIGGYTTVMYKWDGEGFANMNAMFQNGKLISKAQFGLK